MQHVDRTDCGGEDYGEGGVTGIWDDDDRRWDGRDVLRGTPQVSILSAGPAVFAGKPPFSQIHAPRCKNYKCNAPIGNNCNRD